MSNEKGCILCGGEIVYSRTGRFMECAICKRPDRTNAACVNGHFVCNECHKKGLDVILSLCKEETSKNPVEILLKLAECGFCHLHGPEHHVLVGVSLCTAYKNCGGNIDLDSAISEILIRSSGVPGGACGFWGACGAGIATGIFVSVITGSTPLSVDEFRRSHLMTARALKSIGDLGGPRCCKRSSFTAIENAVDFVAEHMGVYMEKSPVVCTYHNTNSQCSEERCPYYPGE